MSQVIEDPCLSLCAHAVAVGSREYGPRRLRRAPHSIGPLR